MQRPTIELSMIVKNEARVLARCLESVSGFIDRIVIGDTGSTDETAVIARQFGAEVLDIPWEQDFALARNRVLRHSQCDWILVLDADEMLAPDASTFIRQLVTRKEVFAFDVLRWNYVRQMDSRSGEQAPIPNPVIVEASCPYPAYALSLNTRLFRRHPGIYFEHCVHETVSGRVDALGLARSQANFVIHHFGQAEDEESIRLKKEELYHELGLKKLKINRSDHRAHFEIGLSELEHYHRPASALTYFEQSCLLKPQNAAAWLFAGICLIRMGQQREAIGRLTKAESLGLRSLVLYEAFGDAHFHLGDYNSAREAYQCALNGEGISPLISAKLGASEVHLGLVEQGTRRMQRAVDAAPEFGELYDILTAGALLGENLPLAARAAETRLSVGQPESAHFRLAAALHIKTGNLPKAQNILGSGLSLFPQDSGLRQLNAALHEQNAL